MSGRCCNKIHELNSKLSSIMLLRLHCSTILPSHKILLTCPHLTMILINNQSKFYYYYHYLFIYFFNRRHRGMCGKHCGSNTMDSIARSRLCCSLKIIEPRTTSWNRINQGSPNDSISPRFTSERANFVRHLSPINWRTEIVPHFQRILHRHS